MLDLITETKMSKFRKKPVVIDAVQLRWDTWSDMCEHIRIGLLEGVMLASEGDWIIKGIKGEVYPCKPDIFAATYEEVL